MLALEWVLGRSGGRREAITYDQLLEPGERPPRQGRATRLGSPHLGAATGPGTELLAGSPTSRRSN